MAYTLPTLSKRPQLGANQVYLMANGDLRLSANQNCWPAQHEMEQAIGKAVEAAGWTVVRAHPYKEDEKHGFIGSQKEGVAVFRKLDPNAPLIVAEAVWQYSHHVLHGLITHHGPILTVANWSGTWPGLVGMLNLNGSLTKAGVKYSTLWGEDFADPEVRRKAQDVARNRQGRARASIMCTPFNEYRRSATPNASWARRSPRSCSATRPSWACSTKAAWACSTRSSPITCSTRPASYKERLSQSALYYETTQVSRRRSRRSALSGWKSGGSSSTRAPTTPSI